MLILGRFKIIENFSFHNFLLFITKTHHHLNLRRFSLNLSIYYFFNNFIKFFSFRFRYFFWLWWLRSDEKLFVNCFWSLLWIYFLSKDFFSKNMNFIHLFQSSNYFLLRFFKNLSFDTPNFLCLDTMRAAKKLSVVWIIFPFLYEGCCCCCSHTPRVLWMKESNHTRFHDEMENKIFILKLNLNLKELI